MTTRRTRRASEREPRVSRIDEVELAEDLAGRTVVLGIGNTLMCDDGVGAVVVRALSERLDERVLLLERQTADLGLMRLFRSGARIFVIDAVDCGGPAGAIYRFTPDEAAITNLRTNNIHGMGVGFLVANARLAGSSPDVTVVGVQVGCVAPDPDRLTPEVAEAAEELARMLAGELASKAAAS